MTWTYDTSTEIGQVRLLIADTDIVPTTDAHYSDEELQVFLTLGGDIYIAAAMALEAWAGALTASVTSERIGDYSYTSSNASQKLALAAQYRKANASSPAFAFSEMGSTYVETEE